MITLRLYHEDDPKRELETRQLSWGDIMIGRDESAQWRIPERDVSRQHCLISLRESTVTVRDISANGVFVGEERRRLDRGAPTVIAANEPIHIGGYFIVADDIPPCANDPTDALDAPFRRPLLEQVRANPETCAIPTQWTEIEEGSTTRVTDASLLDAFCEGARLDASVFAGEDPAEIMRRIGAVYQQLVLGLGDLMGERSSLKSEYRMTRTTVSSAGNNPFKWAPTQRVAIDLLRARDDGFLFGPAAIKESFVDIKKHLVCLTAASRSAVASALDYLSPQTIEANLRGASYLIVGKSDAIWREARRRHEELLSEARGNSESLVNRAFRTGYEQELRTLDEMGTR